MRSRTFRPLGLPIYVARVPAAPFARSYPRHFTFYVANPISSIPDLWQQEAVRSLQRKLRDGGYSGESTSHSLPQKIHSCSFMHHKRLTMRAKSNGNSRVRFGSRPFDFAQDRLHQVAAATAPQFSAVTSAFDDSSRPRYDKLWRISVLHLIVSFLFRITIRWINARGIWCLVAGQ